MALTVFNLPDLGEGLTESVLVSWQVAEGDTVTLNQTIAEVETAKALVELPSPFAGVVSKLHVEAGATVDVDTGGADAAAPAPAATESSAAETAAESEGEPKREPVLVGYGAPADSGKRPARRARKGVPDASDAPVASVPRSGSL
ncbi:MAG TPA: 2-oxo acid dehydrogenase subunit E2, partial [Terrimesophilobacter sp.]|nr:2-oxo acid dehydrogenase subunit E2 [Terrimesophilobacter sp.]